MIIESEVGKEIETEYAEEDNMPTYKHVKTEGDYISLATGLGGVPNLVISILEKIEH